MKYHLVLLCFAIVFSLFFINTAYSVSLSAKYDNAESQTVFIVKQVFELKCNASEDVTIKWEKSGTEINATDSRFVFKKPSSTVYTISTNKATEADAGDYSCVVYDKDQKRGPSVTIRVAQEVQVKVPTNINVVEGEKLKIECQSIGKPTLKWTYRPEGAPEGNLTELVESERVNFTMGDSKIEKSVLEVTGITEKDRGIYTCNATSTAPGSKVVKASCTVRVKGRYAALWPFLGICVEVIVLCLVIFIYEKKRNKTELEESDTDQSPDQKNTPDNGKDSNLRHRQ